MSIRLTNIKPSTILRIVALIILVLAISSVWIFDLDQHLSFEKFKSSRDEISSFVENNYIKSVAVFLSLFISTAFALPGALVLSVAAGFLFGTLPGVIYVDVAATIGATAAFLLSRFSLGNIINNKYGSQLKWLNDEIKRHGKYYLLFLRIVPVMPFFVVNYLAGLTNIRASTLAWTTSLGMLPGAFIYAYAGSHFRSIQSPDDILSGPSIASIAAMGLLAISPIIAKLIKRIKS